MSTLKAHEPFRVLSSLVLGQLGQKLFVLLFSRSDAQHQIAGRFIVLGKAMRNSLLVDETVVSKELFKS